MTGYELLTYVATDAPIFALAKARPPVSNDPVKWRRALAKWPRALQREKNRLARKWEVKIQASFNRLGRQVELSLPRIFGAPLRVSKGGPIELEGVINLWGETDFTETMAGLYADCVRMGWDIAEAILGMFLPTATGKIGDPRTAWWAFSRGSEKIVDITTATKAATRNFFKDNMDKGYDIWELAYGSKKASPWPPLDPPLPSIDGIASFIKETYKHRAENIARTETGFAFNGGSVIRFKDGGIRYVEVLDNEGPNSCERCAEVNGETWGLDFADEHLLEHPRCVRAFAPIIPALATPEGDEKKRGS